MKPETLSKIWTIVATAACYFSINIFIITQGGHFLLPGLKLDDINARAAAVYGTWFATPILFLSLLLVIVFIKRHKDKPSLARFPVAFGLEFDFKDWLAKSYQLFFITAFLLVPTYAAGHFIRKTLHGTVTYKEYPSQVIASTPWEHLTTYKSFTEIFTDGNRYRFEHEITFFPFWQPWLGLFLAALCISLFAYIVYLLLKKPQY